MEARIRSHFKSRIPNASDPRVYALRVEAGDSGAFEVDDLSFLLETYRHQRLGYWLGYSETSLCIRARELFTTIAHEQKMSGEWIAEQLAIQDRTVEGWATKYGDVIHEEINLREERDQRHRDDSDEGSEWSEP